MKKLHVIFDENGNFLQFGLNYEIPENGILIDNDQHAQYLQAINSQLQTIKLMNDEIVIVDKYTSKELANNKALEDKNALIKTASDLLDQSDYMILPDKFPQYPTEYQQSIIAYREALRNVVRGNLTKLPKLKNK